MNISTRVIVLFAFIMVVIVGIVSFYIIRAKQAQLDPLEDIMVNSSSCERGVLKAENDFKRNTYRIVKWGMPSQNSYHPYDDLLGKRFGIQSIVGGCVPIKNVECYNQKMRLLIANKFGLDTREKTYDEARKLYSEYKK